MHFAKLYRHFDSRCKSYDRKIVHILSLRSSISTWEFNYLTETLVSDIWQHWCGFCRQLIISSCQGAKARDFTLISPRLGDNTYKRIGYEASMVKNNSMHKVTPNGHNSFAIRHEPTWGDIDVFIKVAFGLNPSNVGTLTSIFGAPNSLKHLQKLRNACAHKSFETMQELNHLTLDYNFSRLNQPADLAWATIKNGQEFGIQFWLYEMNLIADYATSKS